MGPGISGIEGEDVTLVFEQDQRAYRGLEGLLVKFLRAELRIVLLYGVGGVEEPEAVFEAQRAGGGVVDAAHGHLALVDKFLEQGAEIGLIGFHGHIDSGVDGYTDGVFLVGGHMLALVEVVDVSPVGDDEAIPLEVILEPLGQVFPRGMHGCAVD